MQDTRCGDDRFSNFLDSDGQPFEPFSPLSVDYPIMDKIVVDVPPRSPARSDSSSRKFELEKSPASGFQFQLAGRNNGSDDPLAGSLFNSGRRRSFNQSRQPNIGGDYIHLSSRSLSELIAYNAT
jgi:hypothetical protein